MRRSYSVIFILFALAILALASVGIATAFAYPKLPSLEALTDYRPRIPLRVYSADNVLLAEYGQERREFADIRNVPQQLKQAIIAAEDDRFYEHRGVDFAGLARAMALNLVGGHKQQGGSTITMQVARNFYLSREKTISRKVYEILLALKIEKNLTKDQILELYVNQIYLGQRAYGFAAAAQTYYGKNLANLSLAQCAMLAGLPKAPSTYNPVVNPERAKLRQQYVLRRMRELKFINEKQQQQALEEPLKLVRSTKGSVAKTIIHAEYVAEMARQMAFDQFKEEAYTRGIKVITTIVSKEQTAAYEAVTRNLINYDRRHGYRGAESYVDLTGIQSNKDEALEDLFENLPDSGDLLSAIVLEASPSTLRVYRRGGEIVSLPKASLRYAAPMLANNAPANKRLRRGAVVRITREGNEWTLTQQPEIESAFISADPNTGAVHALVGGFNFYRNKYNHVTQAWRQPGSSFKPFIYSAALEKGYSPTSVFTDQPLFYPASDTGSQDWTPQNYDGKYEGPMSLRTALAKSKNVISIQLLQQIGTRYAQDYITRFGFDAAKHPPYLTMALGAGSVTPWQMAGAYSVFANGGFRIHPYIVKEIVDDNGNVLARFNPPVVGKGAERVIDERNVYLMDSMMQGVVRHGTAMKALALKRGDLAGKTGTTNDFQDAWFCGYQANLVAVSWVGYDQPRKLGKGETGGALALPAWVDYMQVALKGVPEHESKIPDGLVPARAIVDNQPVDDLIYRENLPAAPPATSAPDVLQPDENTRLEAPPLFSDGTEQRNPN